MPLPLDNYVQKLNQQNKLNYKQERNIYKSFQLRIAEKIKQSEDYQITDVLLEPALPAFVFDEDIFEKWKILKNNIKIKIGIHEYNIKKYQTIIIWIKSIVSSEIILELQMRKEKGGLLYNIILFLKKKLALSDLFVIISMQLAYGAILEQVYTGKTNFQKGFADYKQVYIYAKMYRIPDLNRILVINSLLKTIITKFLLQ